MSAIPERRELSFANLDQAVAEAESLASGNVRTTGNHKFANILEHLARTHDMTTGKLEAPRPPLMIRIMMPIMKSFILKDIKPGFKLPPNCLLYTSPSPRDQRGARMPSSA